MEAPGLIATSLRHSGYCWYGTVGEGKARDSKLIGDAGIDIFTRIKGLIVAAIAVEFFAAGLKVQLPELVW